MELQRESARFPRKRVSALRRRGGNWRPCGRAPFERHPGIRGCRSIRPCTGRIAAVCRRSCHMRGTCWQWAPAMSSPRPAWWCSARRRPARAVPPRPPWLYVLHQGDSWRQSGPALRRGPDTRGCRTTRPGTDRSAAACPRSCRERRMLLAPLSKRCAAATRT